MLKLGTQNISGLYVGEQKIKKAFVGEEMVFEDTLPVYTVHFYGIEGSDTENVLESSAHTVDRGGSVTVNPWTIAGYVFEGWYEGDTLISSNSALTYTPTKSETIIYCRYVKAYLLSIACYDFVGTATFTVNGKSYNSTVSSSGNGYVTSVYIKAGEQVTLDVVSLPDGYSFSYWLSINQYGTTAQHQNSYTFTKATRSETVALYGKAASRLPAGYTELEYVQSQNRTSTASYVGCFYYLKPTGATAMRVTFSFGVALSGTAYQPIIGDLKYVNNNRRSFGLWANANGIFAMRDFSNIDTLSTSLSVGAKYTYETECSPSVYTKWYVNESLVNTLTTGISTTFYSRSFGTIGGALSVVYNTVSSNSGLSNITYTMPRGIRLHSVQYLNADGDILLDLVPARNSSGIVGLYDTIANKFYQQSKGGVALNTATLNSDCKINANTPSANYQITAGPAV